MTDAPLNQLLDQRRQFLAFVQRRVSDSGLAEDILQSAYLRAFEHRDDFKPGESAVAWFYRLLRNAVIDSYRRHASRDRALEAWARELEISTPTSPDAQDALCACLDSILDGLKPEYSEILRAVDLGEQRVQDFAEQHSLSCSNAGVRVHRARAALRNSFCDRVLPVPSMDVCTAPVSDRPTLPRDKKPKPRNCRMASFPFISYTSLSLERRPP